MRILLIAWLVLHSARPCIAQGAFADPWKLTDRPTIHSIKLLLNAVNSGDANKVGRFVKEGFSRKFLDTFPLNTHVDYMLSAHAQHGDLVFHSERSLERDQTGTNQVVILKATRTELWQALTVHFATEEPNKINGLHLSAINPPDGSFPSNPIDMEKAIEDLDGYVNRMAKSDVFSGSVLLAKGDKVLYSAAYGLASKRFNVSNNLQTKFNLGSMNKMFTSIAIMQLVEAEKLSLADKLSEFVDETWLEKDVSDKIEIRHLLTHSSGLGSYFNQKFIESSKNGFRVLNDYKPLIRDEKLQFQPGASTRYSNTGMFMLGVVIEKVSGENYFDYIRKHIYEVADMRNSDSYEMDQPVPNLAIGYEPDRYNETGWNNNLYRHVLKGGPAGGGFSTVEDLHRFALALTNFKLLGKKYTEELYSGKPHLHSPDYGYGINVSGTQDNRIVGHGGGFEGISSNLDIYLDKGYVSVVLSNYGSGSRPIERKIRELLERVD